MLKTMRAKGLSGTALKERRDFLLLYFSRSPKLCIYAEILHT